MNESSLSNTSIPFYPLESFALTKEIGSLAIRLCLLSIKVVSKVVSSRPVHKGFLWANSAFKRSD